VVLLRAREARAFAYRACEAAGVACRVEQYEGSDPVGYVVSLNLRRRHLDESQRAMVAAKLAVLAHGQRQTGKFAAVPTQGEAAALLNVSERTIRHARDVLDRGVPELRQAVERGDVSVSAAADVASLSADEQREIVQTENRILEAARNIRARRAEERYVERIGRLCAISKSDVPLTSDRRYPEAL
jgi:hypothetical protein